MIEDLIKVLSNIVAHPGEAKYLSIRVGSKIISKNIIHTPGAMELLRSEAGFKDERKYNSSKSQGKKLDSAPLNWF